METDQGPPYPAIVGRRIGIATFWLAAVYVAVMSTYSVVSQLFFPRRAAAAAVEVGCARQIKELEQDLYGGLATALTARDSVQISQFLEGWDGRRAALPTDCGRLAPARRDLDTLRMRVEAMLDRYDKVQRPLRRRIDSTLDGLAPQARAQEG